MDAHPAEEKEKKDDKDYDDAEQKEDDEDEADETDEADENMQTHVPEEVSEHDREEMREQLQAQQEQPSVTEPEPDAEEEEQTQIAELKKKIAALEAKAVSTRAVKAMNPPWWSEHESFPDEHLLRPPCKFNPGLNAVAGENEVSSVIVLFVLTSL